MQKGACLGLSAFVCSLAGLASPSVPATIQDVSASISGDDGIGLEALPLCPDGMQARLLASLTTQAALPIQACITKRKGTSARSCKLVSTMSI